MARIDRTEFDSILDDNEAKVIAVLREGRNQLAALLFNDLDDANQAFEEAQAAGVATAQDRARLQRATKLYDDAVTTSDPSLAEKAKKGLMETAAALRARVKNAPKRPVESVPAEPVAASETVVDDTTPRSGASVDEIANLLDNKLNPVISVLPKDKDGKLVAVAAKADVDALRTDVDQINNHLGRKVEGGTVTFTNTNVTNHGITDTGNSFTFNRRAALVALILLLLLSLLVGTYNHWGWFSLATFVCIVLSALASIMVGALAPNRTKN